MYPYFGKHIYLYNMYIQHEFSSIKEGDIWRCRKMRDPNYGWFTMEDPSING